MSLLIISGISGAGKSTACDALEDLGYYCIDNLPPKLILPVSKLQSDSQTTKNMAVVVDCRAQEMFESFSNELLELEKNYISYKLLFIDADKEVIINRYKQTRRKHPLISEQTPTLEEAIQKEYNLCKNIKEKADFVVDTTNMSATQMRKYINDMFKTSNYATLTIKIVTFGYRNGIPSEADLVYDVRCLPNPFYINELKPLDGTDDKVYDYVLSFEDSQKMGNMIYDFLNFTLPLYEKEGKSELVVAIGCTSGHHRSVSIARYLVNKLANLNYRIIVVHRDISKPF